MLIPLIMYFQCRYLNRCAGREEFTQLRKYLNIKEQPEIEAGKIEPLKKAIVGLQEQLAEQRLITNTISEENVRTKRIREIAALARFHS